MKTQKLFVLVLAVAAFLVVGASNATACCNEEFQGWIVLGSTSSSGISYVESKICMTAVEELRLRGFHFRDMSQVRPNISVLYFQKLDDTVSLFCEAILHPVLEPAAD